jgi:predicted P-loop ATPase
VTFDEFLQDILIVRDGKRASLDDSAFAMRAWFDDSGWEPVGNEMIRGAVRTVALQRIENLAATYVSGLIETWDGIDRTEGLLDALGIGSKPYTQAVAQYWITAMAARAMTPGVQADNIVVLKGPQGAGKSRVLRALAPVIEGIQTYREGNLDDLLTEERSARLCRGCLILNLDELRQVPVQGCLTHLEGSGTKPL